MIIKKLMISKKFIKFQKKNDEEIYHSEKYKKESNLV